MRLRNAIRTIKRTAAGKELFSYLKERYTDVTVYSQEPFEMAKKAAQYDLVNELLQLGENEDVTELERVITNKVKR